MHRMNSLFMSRGKYSLEWRRGIRRSVGIIINQPEGSLISRVLKIGRWKKLTAE